LVSWKNFLDGIDEIAAFILICSGIAFCYVKNFQDGITMVGVGSAYLFGKNVPKAQR
jgi:hypothetical protein